MSSPLSRLTLHSSTLRRLFFPPALSRGKSFSPARPPPASSAPTSRLHCSNLLPTPLHYGTSLYKGKKCPTILHHVFYVHINSFERKQREIECGRNFPCIFLSEERRRKESKVKVTPFSVPLFPFPSKTRD